MVSLPELFLSSRASGKPESLKIAFKDSDQRRKCSGVSQLMRAKDISVLWKE